MHHSKVVKIILLVLWCIATVPLFAALPQDSLVTLCFGGDVTFANHFEHHVGNRFDYPFARLNVMRDADLAMVNLENPLTVRGEPAEKQYTFRAQPHYTRVLQLGGIDLVTIANNHIWDYQEQGLFDTIDHLDSAGIKHVGAGKNLSQARRAATFEIKGITLAFLGYYGLGRHSDSHPASKDSAGTAPRYLSYIKEDIRALRDSVDLIIVNVHWGQEKEHYPDPEQIEMAHKIIDYGADLIIGHHPHVLQGIERYKGRTIAYSLGNFIFGGNSRTYEESALLKIIIDPKNATAYKTRVVPVRIAYWQPAPLEEGKSLLLMERLREYSSAFGQSIF